MVRSRYLSLVIAILLAATALRFYLIESQSFWNDEGNSARLSERSIGLIIEGTASDIHPPLYYLALRGWREFTGETEFALRGLSAFAGVALVAVTISLGRKLIGPESKAPALVAAVFATISPALVYYSQEARMYELMAFLSLLSSLFMVLWLQNDRRRWGWALAYILSSAAGLYTHYFYPAVLAAQNIVFVIWIVSHYRSGQAPSGEKSHLADLIKPVGKWTLMMLAVALLYSPWIRIYWEQAGDRTPVRALWSDYLVDTFQWSSLGPTFDTPAARWVLMAFFVLVILGVWFGRRLNQRGLSYLWILVALILTPLLLMWFVGATQPAFYKFILVIIPPLCLLAGPGWWWSWRWASNTTSAAPPRYHSGSDLGQAPRGDRENNKANPPQKPLARAVIAILGIVVILGSGRSLTNMYADPAYARADYRGMAEQIAQENYPNAGIVLNAANQWEVFTYYHRDGAPVYPIPRGYPDQSIIEAELDAITAEHDRLYALFWGDAEQDPERSVERWLDANAYKAREEWRGDVRFVTYAIPSSEAVEEELVGIGDIRFGTSIRLEKALLSSSNPWPGEIVQVSLHWTAEDVLDERYKVFLHLVDQEGRIIAQRDSEPGGGLALTTTWTPGVTVVDNHGIFLPMETIPGQYTLLLGLYDLSDPLSRLPLSPAIGDSDALPLGTIYVGEPQK